MIRSYRPERADASLGPKKQFKIAGLCRPLNALFVLAVCGHIMAAGCAHAPATGDVSSGFRGIPWGTLLAQVPSMELMDQGYGRALGQRPDDVLTFGKIPLQKITYESREGRFFAATLHFLGEDNYTAILRRIQDEHGTPKIAHAYANVYVWHPDQVSLSLRYYRSEGRGEARYAYLPLALSGQFGESD